MTGPTMQLTMPSASHFYMHIKENAPYAIRMAGHLSHTGQSVAICGAGVSLATAQIPHTDHVWACNSALPYLMDRGDRVTHGFCIDQGEEMLDAHEWGRLFDVRYLVASSVHPRLVTSLSQAGKKMTFFHSYLGIPEPGGWVAPIEGMTYEMYLYTQLYPTGVQVGYGLNSVPRAVCLAEHMGFKDILVYGADCACAPNQPRMPLLGTPEYNAWLDTLPMYADGRTAGTFGYRTVMAEATIDGKRWHTRADMVISAKHLVDLYRTYAPRIQFMGDTLPNAIKDKDAAWFEDMPGLSGQGQVVGFGDGATNHPQLQQLEAVA